MKKKKNQSMNNTVGTATRSCRFWPNTNPEIEELEACDPELKR